MNTDNCITLENVAIGYSGKVLLKDINFSLKVGEFVVLFGPNGSGKTTLFKTILRIIPPIQGAIIYGNGQPTRFGYVPQRQYLDEIYPFTAEEVVLMGTFGQAKPFCPTPKTNRVWIEQCLKDVGMLDMRKKLFSELYKKRQLAIMLVTHEVHHIPSWVNKIIHIHHYKVVLGSLEEIISLSRIDEIPTDG